MATMPDDAAQFMFADTIWGGCWRVHVVKFKIFMRLRVLLFSCLLLMPYDVSAREEPVENRIVNAFNSLPAALKNSVPPIELLFVNDFKELQDEVARQRGNTSTLSPRFTAVALNRPAIIFVKSELRKKELNDDE